MPFEYSLAHAFSPTSIRAHAPSAPGVYGISNARQWVFVGATQNIRESLLRHVAELGTLLARNEPKGFVFELCGDADQISRCDRLIAEYAPVCNRCFDSRAK